MVEGWEIVDGKLTRTFRFDSYLELCGFLVKVMMLSEKANHHPLCEFSYNFLRLSFFTHSSNSISAKDFELADKINKLVVKE